MDLADLPLWGPCATGPVVESGYPEGCESFDFENDGDVDLVDLATLQGLMEP